MMRPLLNLAICGLVVAPCAALAQAAPPSEISPSPVPTAAVLAPTPTLAPTEPAPAAVEAPPPPSAEAGAPAPELEPPTTVAPVILAKEDKGDGVKTIVGTTAFGVAGGVAGAAVAGPVGKFAGGFIFKRVAQGLFGDKDKTPELTVIPQTPSATGAAAPAAHVTNPRATLVAEER